MAGLLTSLHKYYTFPDNPVVFAAPPHYSDGFVEDFHSIPYSPIK
jgi:hypothetical protein